MPLRRKVAYNVAMKLHIVFVLVAVTLIALPVLTAEENQVAIIERATTLLRSRYWDDRKEGAELLESLDADCVPQLITLLDDFDGHVAAAAAIELARRKEASCVPKLYELIKNDPVRYHSVILPLLSSFGSSGYDKCLFDLLIGSDDKVSVAVASCIAQFIEIEPASNEIWNTLQGMMTSSNFRRRVCAERVFTKIGALAVPYLIRMLGQRFPYCFGAMNSLVGIGAPAVKPLLDVSLSKEDGAIALRAATTLAQIADESAFEAICKIVEASADPLVRSAAGLALRSFSQDASQLYELLINDTDARVRASVLVSLYSIEKWPEKLSPSLVVARLGDVSAEVRMNAVIAAGRHKIDDAVAILPNLYNDASQFVVANALWTTGNYKDTSLVQYLMSFIDSRDSMLRLAAAKSLLQLGSSIGESVAIRALRDDSKRCANALYALSYATSKQAVDAIIEALPKLRDEHKNLARFSLYSITGAYFEIERWPKWWTVNRRFYNTGERIGFAAYFRGLLHEESGLEHVAKEYYEMAALNAPSFPDAHYAHARYLISTGDSASLQKAVTELNKAIALLPQSRYYVSLAEALMGLKRFDEALDVVRAGLAADDSEQVRLKELEKKILNRMSQ